MECDDYMATLQWHKCCTPKHVKCVIVFCFVKVCVIYTVVNSFTDAHYIRMQANSMSLSLPVANSVAIQQTVELFKLMLSARQYGNVRNYLLCL